MARFRRPRYGRRKKSAAVRKRRYAKKPAKKAISTVFRKGRTYKIHPDPFPPRLICRMKYATQGQLLASATQNYYGLEHVYRLTSIYDPYYSTGGTTTVGYSNMANLYQKYIVYGAKIEITFYDSNLDGQIPTVSLNQTDVLQAKSVKTAGEQSLTYSTQLNNTGSQKKTFRFYVKPWALGGLSKLEWMANKSTRSSLMGTNPSEETYLRLALAASNASGSTNTINYTLRIIYFTELFDRVQLTSSVSTG